MNINLSYRVIPLIFLATILSGCGLFGSSGHGKSKTDLSGLYVDMGVRYMDVGKMDIALEKLEHALELNPNNGDAHNALAVFYDKINLLDKADVHFNKALRIKPNDSSIANNYGKLLCKRGDYDKAFSYINKALALPMNDRQWYALANAGQCYQTRGDNQAAEDNYRKALSLHGTFAPALKGMAYISFDANKNRSARAFLERYLNVADENEDTLLLGVKIEQAIGNQRLKKEYAEKLDRLYPNSKQAREAAELVQ
ncbi:MAG: type IV pilus biogenesis/stability protein PilW [Methylococcaceae bacterium]